MNKLNKILLFNMILLFGVLSAFSFAQTKQSDTKKYIKLEVNGLACPFCAYGLEKKLKAIKGAEDFYVDIKDGYAVMAVPLTTKVTKHELKKLVSDAGFELKSVEFSDKPFKESRNENGS